jgi:hypothetical protein
MHPHNITETVHLIICIICGTDNAFHAHEELASLCSLKGTMGQRFLPENKENRCFFETGLAQIY